MQQSIITPAMRGKAQGIVASLRRDLERVLAAERARDESRKKARATFERRQLRKETLERLVMDGRRDRIVHGLDNLLSMACDPAISELAGLQLGTAAHPGGINLYSAERVFGQGWD